MGVVGPRASRAPLRCEKQGPRTTRSALKRGRWKQRRGLEALAPPSFFRAERSRVGRGLVMLFDEEVGRSEERWRLSPPPTPSSLRRAGAAEH